MKDFDFSLFLLKNSLASKMKRGFRSFCSGVGSTSTLNQPKADTITLEQMLLQVEMEEAAERRAEMEENSDEPQRRMSCVNNSDILRSARNALNQYPRFSLDGRDAMYRSSFRSRVGPDVEDGRRAGCRSGFSGRNCINGCEVVERLPSTVSGESVVWCKPGVVAKLMGLDEVPVPVGGRGGRRRVKVNPVVKRKEEDVRKMGRRELERERLVMGIYGCEMRTRAALGWSPAYDYCLRNPTCFETGKAREDWRFRRPR